MKRIVALVMTLILLCGLTVPASAADTAVGVTLRLEKTEGTVTVKSASGRKQSIRSGMRLYSGTTIKTDKESYAYISLDSGKAVKLGASSEGEVRRSGKKLELNLISGELFFDVSIPLEEDESLDIRTSTMVTGVRGTVGYVRVVDAFHSEVALLEGTLTVRGAAYDSQGSGSRSVVITGGQKAVGQSRPEQPEAVSRISVLPLKEEEVPGFAAVEVKADIGIQERIGENSPLSVPKIIGDAQERLDAEEKAAEAADEKLRQEMEKQEPSQEQPSHMFESTTPKTSGGGSSSNGGNSNSSASDSVLRGAVDCGQLEQAFAKSDDVKLGDTAVLTVDRDVSVPAGKTLTAQSGSRTDVQSGTLLIEGTVNIEQGAEAAVAASGGISVASTDSLHLNGVLTNSGVLAVGVLADGVERSGLLEVAVGGSLINAGTVEVRPGSTLAVADGGSLDNRSSGELRVDGEGGLAVSGTVTNGGVCRIVSESTEENGGTVVKKGGVFRNQAQFSLGGAGETESGMLTVESGGLVDNSGASAQITVERSGGILCAGELRIGSGTTLRLDGGETRFTAGGSFANSGQVLNTAAVTLEAGSVFTNQGIFTNGTTDNAAEFRGEGPFENTGTLANFGTLSVSGGFVNRGTLDNHGQLTLGSGDSAGDYRNQGTLNNLNQLTVYGAFTNDGDYTNGSGSTLDMRSGSVFHNNGSFTNHSSGFAPGEAFPGFRSTGRYTDDTLDGVNHLLTVYNETEKRGQVLDCVAVEEWTIWGGETPVKAVLYGSGTGAVQYGAGLTVPDGAEVLLDLNGKSLDLGVYALMVEGALTLQNSSGRAEDGKITSENSIATIQCRGGRFEMGSDVVVENTGSGEMVRELSDTETGLN